VIDDSDELTSRCTITPWALTRSLLASAIEALLDLSLSKLTEFLDEVGVPSVIYPNDVTPVKRQALADRAALIGNADVAAVTTRFIDVARRRYPGILTELAFKLEEAAWKAEPATVMTSRRIRNDLLGELDEHDVKVFERAPDHLSLFGGYFSALMRPSRRARTCSARAACRRSVDAMPGRQTTWCTHVQGHSPQLTPDCGAHGVGVARRQWRQHDVVDYLLTVSRLRDSQRSTER